LDFLKPFTAAFGYLIFHVLPVSLHRTDVIALKAGDTISSRHVSSCDVNACSWDSRGDL